MNNIINEVNNNNLDALLRSNNKFYYTIPVYQRMYSWGTKHCLNLIEDIHNVFNQESEGYFLGSIILTKQKDNNIRYDIVDGQQRLTSLLLLFRALFMLSPELLSGAKGIFNNEKGLRLETKIRELGSIEKLERILNLENEESNKYLENCISKEFKSRGDKSFQSFYDNDPYSANFITIYKKLKEVNIDYKKFYDFLLEKVYLVYVVCSTVEQGLLVFNTFNGRGMPLSNSDIIKGEILCRLKDTEIDNFVNEEWTTYINKEGFQNIFTAWCYVNNAMEKDNIFFNKYRENSLEYIKNYLKHNESSIDFWNEIKEMFKFQELLLSGETLHRDFLLLNETGIQWFYAYYIAEKIKKYDSEQLNKIRKQLLKIAIIKSGESSTTKRVLSSNLAKDIFNNEYDKKFKKIIEQYQIDNIPVKLIACFDMLYFEDKEIFENDLCNLYYESDYEHILPKGYQYNGNYSVNWTEEKYNEDINRIGNLIVLEKNLNRSAGNKRFSEKKNSYEKSKFACIQNLTKIEDWNQEELEKREQAIISKLHSFLKD